MINTYTPYPQYDPADVPRQEDPQEKYRQMAYTLQQPQPYAQGQTGTPTMNPMAFMNQGSGGGLFGGSAGSSPIMAGGDAGIGGGGSAGGSSGGAMGGLGPMAAIAAAVAATKGLEARNDDNGLGAILRTFNAPSGAQIAEDPKMAGLGALTGMFPLMNHFMNDDAKKARPEWESFLGF